MAWNTNAFFRNDLQRMEYHVSRISYLVQKGLGFVVLPEAHCWQGSGRFWNYPAEHRFASRIFTSPHPPR
eukprot:15288183-Alexandrium_andersonii.AAC.1